MSLGQRVLLWAGALVLGFLGAVNFQDAMIAYGGLLRAQLGLVMTLVYLPLAGAFFLAYIAPRG
jgi:hypothetical protein